jgi:hypothetical protein
LPYGKRDARTDMQTRADLYETILCDDFEALGRGLVE